MRLCGLSHPIFLICAVISPTEQSPSPPSTKRLELIIDPEEAAAMLPGKAAAAAAAAAPPLSSIEVRGSPRRGAAGNSELQQQQYQKRPAKLLSTRYSRHPTQVLFSRLSCSNSSYVSVDLKSMRKFLTYPSRHFKTFSQTFDISRNPYQPNNFPLSSSSPRFVPSFFPNTDRRTRKRHIFMASPS